MPLTQLIDTYCAAWSTVDADRRGELLLPIWGADATYTDPTVHAVGADELLAHIAGLQARQPGTRIMRTTAVDAHHGLARFGWQLTMPDGSEVDGLDIVFLDPGQQRIARVIGFFGQLAAA